jgi:hypothetical protein
LQAELPSGASRRKSCSILMKIWVRLPERSMGLRERALQLLPQISGQDRVWLHWGMTARAYPFFRDTAEVIGRLLALQDDFRGVGVQSRLTGAWGDRVTTKLAAGHLLRMLLDWDVLRTKSKSGQFLQVQKLTTGNRELQLWLLEALLGASAAEEIEAQQLLRLPESFTIIFLIGSGELRRAVICTGRASTWTWCPCGWFALLRFLGLLRNRCRCRNGLCSHRPVRVEERCLTTLLTLG